MTRNSLIMWFGRIATIVFTIAVFTDIHSDQHLSREIRLAVLAIVMSVFVSLAGWQGYIAQKYDGWPVTPLSFRWVVFVWLASFVLFIGWTVLITFWESIYSDRRSAVLWWQFGVSSLWFASRWITIDTPQQAGIGETGSTPSNGNGGGA